VIEGTNQRRRNHSPSNEVFPKLILLAVIASGMGSHIDEFKNPPEQMTVVLKVLATRFFWEESRLG
jgi:hypothetical protein